MLLQRDIPRESNAFWDQSILTLVKKESKRRIQYHRTQVSCQAPLTSAS